MPPTSIESLEVSFDSSPSKIGTIDIPKPVVEGSATVILNSMVSSIWSIKGEKIHSEDLQQAKANMKRLLQMCEDPEMAHLARSKG